MKKIALGLAGCLMATAPVQLQAQAKAETQVSESDVAVVQAQLDAYRARDFSAFMAAFSDDAVVIYDGLMVRGRADIRTVYSANFLPDSPSVYLVDSGIQGHQIWLQAGYTFADGSGLCCSLSRYTVHDGRIVHLDVTGPR